MTRAQRLLFSVLVASAIGCDGPVAPPADAGRSDAPVDAGPPDCAVTPLVDDCLPDEPTYEGPTAAIEVLRDAMGVPHVYAATDEDANFGSGYMQAYDRLFQMELTRRRGAGRRAEILGAGYYDEDRLIRLMNIPHWAEVNRRLVLVGDPELYGLLQAWVAGVNRRIEEVTTGGDPLPFGFEELDFVPEPWTVADAYLFGKTFLFGNANALEFDVFGSVLTQYAPDVVAGIPVLRPLRDVHTVPSEDVPTGSPLTFVEPRLPEVPIAHPLPSDFVSRWSDFHGTITGAFGSLGASNNWAVAGAHTASGHPILCGDPHQGLQSPSLMWLHGMHSAEAGGLDVVGFSFVGTPSVALGHNRDVAWAATTNYPDWMDLFIVDWDAPAGTIELGGETLAIVLRHEEIRVAGEAAPRTIDVEEVPGHGLLLPEDFLPVPLGAVGQRVLFDWAGFRPTHDAHAFLALDRAETVEDVERLADAFELGAFNFLAVDATNITYRSSPLVPVRRGTVGVDGLEPWHALDGSDPMNLWSGDLLRPGIDLPHGRGTTDGYLASANNEPYGFLDDGSVVGDPLYFGVYFDPGTRAARIEDELTRLVARGDVTLDDMHTLQDDTHSEIADDLVPVLEAVWADRATDPALTEFRTRADLDLLVDALSAWDRRMERTSGAALVFHLFAHHLAREVLSDDLALIFDALFSASAATVIKFLIFVLDGTVDAPEEYLEAGRSLAVAHALDETAMALAARFGSSNPSGYTWGEAHVTCFHSIYGEALEGGCVSTDGGEGTVNVADSNFGDGEADLHFETNGGSIFRLAMEMGDDGVPHATVNAPRGVSGDPTSPYWDNLEDDWVENRYQDLLFERAAVEASASGTGGGGTLTITP